MNRSIAAFGVATVLGAAIFAGSMISRKTQVSSLPPEVEQSNAAVSRLDNDDDREVGKKTIATKLVVLQEKTLPSEEIKPSLAFETSGFDEWREKVAAQPAKQQVEAVIKKLNELNPEFNGVMRATTKSGAVTAVTFGTENGAEYVFVTIPYSKKIDLSPLRAFTNLKHFEWPGTNLVVGLSDLSPLVGMPLESVRISNSGFTDLAPLKGMPLKSLSVINLNVSSLTALDGLSLEEFDCYGCKISDLTPLQGMPLKTLRCSGNHVSDLSPLRGMPLEHLVCNKTPVSDLSPLRGMLLRHLDCDETQVSDLSPLAGMPLDFLSCTKTHVSDLSPLESCKCLTNVSMRATHVTESGVVALQSAVPACKFTWNKPITTFLQPAFQDWATKVAQLPAENQIQAVIQKLKELNPDFQKPDSNFNETVKHQIKDGVVIYLDICTGNVSDISPVRALPGLKHLRCSGDHGELVDLSPLKSIELTHLEIGGNHLLFDLSPLKGMNLTKLTLGGMWVSNLCPLIGMPLKVLYCESMPLTDLSPLRGMQLETLMLRNTPITNLSNLEGMPLTALELRGTQVTDLSPIKGMPLKYFFCDFKFERDSELLMSMKTIERINEKTAAEFWEAETAKEQDVTP